MKLLVVLTSTIKLMTYVRRLKELLEEVAMPIGLIPKASGTLFMYVRLKYTQRNFRASPSLPQMIQLSQ